MYAIRSYYDTAVIVKKSFWFKKNKSVLGESEIYGPLHRDPCLFPSQGDNIHRLWSVEDFDKYLKERYNVSFKEIYGNFTGIILNPINTILHHQMDSDGDLVRVAVPFDKESQDELKRIYDLRKDFSFFKGTESLVAKYFSEVNNNWLWDYFVGECQKADEKSYFPTLKVSAQTTSSRNLMIIKSANKKEDIGPITKSMWSIHALAFSLLARKVLTLQEVIYIVATYQAIIVQQGTVRSLKASLDLTQCSYNFV